jgi:hypothetical protein
MNRLCVLAAALTVTLLVVEPTSAAGNNNKTPSPFAAQIKELHDVKVLLERADRDYKGHRAEAVKQIDHAIHALSAGHKHPHGKGAKNGGREPQALSDAQLRDSIKVLDGVLTQLNGAANAPATRGAVHIASAIKQLEVALTIK